MEHVSIAPTDQDYQTAKQQIAETAQTPRERAVHIAELAIGHTLLRRENVQIGWHFDDTTIEKDVIPSLFTPSTARNPRTRSIEALTGAVESSWQKMSYRTQVAIAHMLEGLLLNNENYTPTGYKQPEASAFSVGLVESDATVVEEPHAEQVVSLIPTESAAAVVPPREPRTINPLWTGAFSSRRTGL